MKLQETSADVIDLAHDGRGIARIGGKVTFVTGGLPGETVRLRITGRGKQTDEAEMVAIERASAERVTPRCRHFGTCGGCTLQHLSPAGQRALKQKQLLDALTRIGKVEPGELAPPVLGPDWGYRRRARLRVFREKDGRVRVGFHQKGTPWTTPLTACEVLDPRIGHSLAALAECLAKLGPGARVSQIEVAAAEPVALVLRVMGVLHDADREQLQDFAERAGFEIYLQTGGPATVQSLQTPTPLAYSPDGSDLRLAFAPADFIQVNGAVNQHMVRQALDWLAVKPGEAVLELFSGLGNFSLPLARAGARITAVEGEAALVARAQANAHVNGLELRCIAADLFNPDAQAAWLRRPYDAVLLDPPRSGAQEVLAHAGTWRASRILYVSCHPGTLARDAGALVHRHGYRLLRAGILDMFPHTTHVESMALFVRAA